MNPYHLVYIPAGDATRTERTDPSGPFDYLVAQALRGNSLRRLKAERVWIENAAHWRAA